MPQEGQNSGQRVEAQLPYKEEYKLRSKVGIWRGQGIPQVRKRRLERTDPAGPSRLPDLIRKAKDSDRDFKQDIFWRMEWRGAGVAAQTSASVPGPQWFSTGASGAGALVMLLQRNNELLQESRGTSGLPEMKSYNTGLSGPVCGKEQKGCLFTFHIRPQRPCIGGRFPRGKGTVVFCRTHNTSS